MSRNLNEQRYYFAFNKILYKSLSPGKKSVAPYFPKKMPYPNL